MIDYITSAKAKREKKVINTKVSTAYTFSLKECVFFW